MFNPAILIPFYNHQVAIEHTLAQISRYNYSVLIVDDGSSEVASSRLAELTTQFPGTVTVLRLEQNSGKGAAVKAGFFWLQKNDFTHALQIDADGQHDLDKVREFMEHGEAEPNVVICGNPIFSEDIPKGRFYGRYLTHVWVWINTLSFQIKDSMCGFRLYPLASMAALLERHSCGERMDFDTEILVRAQWCNIPMTFISLSVRYPEGGVSHFQPMRDNVLISWMHTRLFFGMLVRLPLLLRRHFRES